MINQLQNISKTPDFLKLLSHDIRWQMLQALGGSDLRVQELVYILNQPQNLVSYHLQRLRQHGVVQERRSSADGREVYYSLNLARMQDLYRSSANQLHPALDAEPEPQAIDLPEPIRVLFLCTHNSARSQMAEGLLRARSAGLIDSFSAGTEPGMVNPYAIRAMGEMNIDISQQRSKNLSEFLGQDFDYIITVCDRARETCPIFPGDPVQIHWSFPDPSTVEGDEETRLAAFRETARGLNTRITYLLLMVQRDQENR